MAVFDGNGMLAGHSLLWSPLACEGRGKGIALSPSPGGRLEGSKSVSQVVRFVSPLTVTGESVDSISIFPLPCLMVMGLASGRRIHARGMVSEKKRMRGLSRIERAVFFSC